MGLLQEDFTDALQAFWTETVGAVTLADSVANAADGNKIVVTSDLPTGTQQEVEGFVALTAVSANHVAPELWLRVGTTGTNFVKGYGLRLTLTAATAVTLEILHTTGPAETITTLADVTGLAPAQVAASGANIWQHIRLVCFERLTDSDAPEQVETTLRAYLNEEDDNAPALEFVHRSVATPIWREAGTFAIRFRHVDGRIDSWAGHDAYAGPTADVLPADKTTLGAMRAQLEQKVTLGGLSNNDAAVVNQMIVESCRAIINRLGDKALFMERLKQVQLTSTGTAYLLTAPRDVVRIMGIYDIANGYPLSFEPLTFDEKGRQMLRLDDSASATAVWLHYFGKFLVPTSDSDLLPIPSTYDECILMGALMRFAGMENRADILSWSTALYEQAFSDLQQAMTVVLRSRRPRMYMRWPMPQPSHLSRASIEWVD